MTKCNIEAMKHPTQAYGQFSSEVSAEVSRIFAGGVVNEKVTELYLNGAASKAVTQHISRETRSKDGIFFSGKKLAQQVANYLKIAIANGATVADPTCGAGDLLLACASIMKRGDDLTETIESWTSKIVGLDLHENFIEAAKARLALLATQQVHVSPSIMPVDAFSGLRKQDYFHNTDAISQSDCVVMNPPFASTEAPAQCLWAKGKVQLAGVIFETVLTKAKLGQEIVAILPDVLRCGSRYQRWREYVEKFARIVKIDVYGKFDESTDVDVFIIHLIKSENPEPFRRGNWIDDSVQKQDSWNYPRTEDFFTVSVGAYVPFRANFLDETSSYLCVADAIPDAELAATSRCRFNGKKHIPPFVVIRRTSNPSDLRRVIPTLINGPDEVAVENHLIVIRPLDGLISSCRTLMESIQNKETDAWMNQVSRCRHLTTRLLKQLPLIGWK